ncbi:MAG: hypothetical protein U9Q79_06695, partial [Candidatus Hydrogenedentes bacterium]|nr:hypothetical protein [Candidatus Hydrogenedentota bacterium]
NIFQAFGRWETWSSPSSDVDRRNKYFYLADWLEYAIRLYGLIPSFVDLTGLEAYDIQNQSDLAEALLAEKNRIFAERSMEYTNSKGEKVRLTLLDIEERLYDLSFDPNHPPELRWGAPIGSEERASAPQTWTPAPDGTKVAMEDAYRWQAFYRSLGQRETELSCLRGMFTSGYPIRDKLDAQVGKWIDETPMVVAEQQTPPEETKEAMDVPPLVPANSNLFEETTGKANFSDNTGYNRGWTFTDPLAEQRKPARDSQSDSNERRRRRRR